MRAGRTRGESAILGVVAITIGIFCLSTVERWNNPEGAARLVSIEELSDVGFEAPSITVHSLEAKDDAAPLCVIQDSNTQLNWPEVMSLKPDTGDLCVANDQGHSILVFQETSQGKVPPRRVIKGGRAGLSHPVSVFVDTKNKEQWA